ncbi:hypothetical protein [Cyanobium sp. ATX-6F1]|uniref:hypothetical protein n=1 Tax=Cyanobium sp. ATX-6F1 TaxID=3137388 RepID=UPI0039BDA76A
MDQSLIPRRLLLLVLDGALISLAFWAAFAFRLLDNASPQFELQLHLLPWALFIGLSVLLSSGWYRSLTRYSGSHSLYGLLPRAGLAVLLLLLVSTLLGGAAAPFLLAPVLAVVRFLGDRQPDCHARSAALA